MLTVLFATRNGSRTLPSVLETFVRLQPPPSGWKLVVVDNGSTDQTRAIVTSFKEKLPLTYIFEARGGKNVALNTGLEHLEGDLAVFTDDDVFPRPDWLLRLRAAADAHPEYSMFGGVVLPRWEVTPPRWIKWVDKRIVFAITDPAMVEGPIQVEFVFGPNMAIRTEAFNRGVRFDASIGPRGPKYAMGSETELLLRLSKQGYRAWHAQDAVVEHFIRERQMNKSWALERAIRFGRGRFRVSPPDANSRPHCFGIPVGFFSWLLKKGVKRAVAWWSFDEQAIFSARWEFNYVFGQIIEARIMHRERHTVQEQFTN